VGNGHKVTKLKLEVSTSASCASLGRFVIKYVEPNAFCHLAINIRTTALVLLAQSSSLYTAVT
jgi:hypothetical protein